MPDELIDKATRVMYDGVHDYDRLSDQLKDVYRQRARALADAGLLADPEQHAGLVAQIGLLREEMLRWQGNATRYAEEARERQARIAELEQVIELVRTQNAEAVEQVDTALGHRYHTPGVHYSVPHIAEKAAAEIEQMQARLDAVSAACDAAEIAVKIGTAENPARWETAQAAITDVRAALQGEGDYPPLKCPHCLETIHTGPGSVKQADVDTHLARCEPARQFARECAAAVLAADAATEPVPGLDRDADAPTEVGGQPTETRGGGAQGGEEPSENSRDGDEPGSAVVGAGHGTTTPANSPRPDQPDVWRENGRWCWRSLPGGEAEAHMIDNGLAVLRWLDQPPAPTDTEDR